MPAPSFELVNYTLRPAKHAERLMMAEVFQRLRLLTPLREYVYVGLPSIYFRDFILMHEALGISRLVSIERQRRHKRRFEFNRPYRCIDLKFGESRRVLPTLSWTRPAIVWLDYDSRLSTSMLRDIAFVIDRAASGSVLVVTVDADARTEPTIRDDVERELGPLWVRGETAESLWGHGLGNVYYRLIASTVAETLIARNGDRDEGDPRRVLARQLFNFRYSDGTDMRTVGYLVHARKDSERVAACSFEDFEFVRSGSTPYDIVIPRLTYREIHRLESELPAPDARAFARRWFKRLRIPVTQGRRFSELYRYFPTYVEADF